MRSPLCDGAIFENKYLICAADGTDAVCDNQFGRVRKRIQRFLYLVFGLHIQCGRGVVHD